MAIEELRTLVSTGEFDWNVARKFIQRIGEGNLTRAENPESHISTYLFVVDYKACLVYLGLHKKSGLVLGNGGHVELGESPTQTYYREFGEELGNYSEILAFPNTPEFLSVTEGIDNPGRNCRTHYDFWYFIEADHENFNPDEEKVKEEFGWMKWLTLREAREIVTDKSTLQALDVLEEKIQV